MLQGTALSSQEGTNGYTFSFSALQYSDSHHLHPCLIDSQVRLRKFLSPLASQFKNFQDRTVPEYNGFLHHVIIKTTTCILNQGVFLCSILAVGPEWYLLTFLHCLGPLLYLTLPLGFKILDPSIFSLAWMQFIYYYFGPPDARSDKLNFIPSSLSSVIRRIRR